MQGGYLNLHMWRRREWAPALRAAGFEHRGPYTLRHTFASASIAAGVSLFDLSRLMGTSVEQFTDGARSVRGNAGIGARGGSIVSDPNYDRERLRDGWLDLHRADDGKWSITWAPDEGHADWPGRTYSPADPDLPGDYPGAHDKDALIEWGRKRWGGVYVLSRYTAGFHTAFDST